MPDKFYFSDILWLIIILYEKFFTKKMTASKPSLLTMETYCFALFLNHFPLVERVTGLEPATVCLEGRNSSQLSYTRIYIRSLMYKLFLILFKGNFIWAWLGSNQRPIGYEPTALTTELHTHVTS